MTDMILLNGSDIKKVFSGEILFENVSFHVNDNDKIGFVGANGAGKSTLFKIITDELDADGGEIFKSKDMKIGYLDQYALSDSDLTVWDEAAKAFSRVSEIENKLEELRFDIENKNGDLDELVKRQTEMQEQFAALDGFYYKSKLRSTLLGLGFSEDEFNMTVKSLSGGQKTRLSLGRLLLADTNLLLLDEPTNHLDIESVEWLEEFLKAYRGAFIVISHDRYFLDKISNRIFEMRNGRLRTYNGNYSAYVKQSEVDKKTEERNYANTKNEIERLEAIVEQQRRWNREKNIKTAESKIKVIERLEQELVKPDADAPEMRFKFKAAPGGGQEVLVTKDLSKTFDGNTLFKNADVFIKKGERVFLTGPNGCGKTTFLKIVLGQIKPTDGEYKIGANILTGYYDQLQENLHMEKTVLDELYDEYPDKTITELRNALAVFLFRGEDVFKKIEELSGGERARVELAKLMLKVNNFLIMDEPTNHLDIDSREALEKALEGYDGTILTVSHDRYFINKLADRIIYMTPNGMESFSGNYDDYIKSREEKSESHEEKTISAGKLNYIERKQQEAQKRKTINRFKKVEDEISKNEDKIKEKETELLNPEISSDYVRLEEISKEIEDMNAELDGLYSEWEELQAIIEREGYEI